MFIKDSKEIVIKTNDKEYSYNELLKYISYFSKINISKNNDRCVIYFENRPEWCFAYFSNWKNKSIPVPVDFMCTTDELAYILKDSKPKTVFYSNETKNKTLKAIKLSGIKTKKINIDEVKVNLKKEIAIDLEEPKKDQTASILYTSGTTGDPKGVMLSYDNIYANILAVSKDDNIYKKESIVMILLPLHHILPLCGSLLVPLYAGSTIVFCPKISGPEIMNTLSTHHISVIIGVPRLYSMIFNGIMEKINASFVKKTIFKIAKLMNSRKFSKKIFKQVHDKFGGNIDIMVSGGAPLDKNIAEGFLALGLEVWEGYGMTETAPMITSPTHKNGPIPGKVGVPIPYNKIKIVDGEVLVKGRNVMKGYYKKPDETKKVIKNGWLHTGDLGAIDKKGYLKITGRKKEIIVLPNGKNINPNEIEEKLINLTDKSEDLAVLYKNNILHAIIKPDLKKLHESEISNLDEFFKWQLIDKYNKSCTPYKKVMKYNLTSMDIPRTRLGKVRRHLLDNLTESAEVKLEKIDEPDYSEYRILKKYLEKEKKVKVFPQNHLEVDLGLDSLDRVSLTVFLNSHFKINLNENTLSQYSTVEKLAEYLKSNDNKKPIKANISWSQILKNIKSSKLPESKFPHITILKLFKRYMNFISAFRIKIYDMENIPAAPFIFAPNHQSHLDAMILLSFLNKQTVRKTYVFAKKKHFASKFRSFFAARFNIIIMDIQNDLHDSIKQLAEVLKSNSNLIIFPEGTRSRDGRLNEFKKTFAILSKELDVPVVPVTINGSKNILKRDSYFIKPFQKVEIRFSTPVYPDDINYDEISEKVKSVIESNLKI